VQLQRVISNANTATGYFLTQGFLIYTIGIKLFMYLRFAKNTNFSLATIATFITCLVVTGLVGEVMYRGVELPGRRGVHVLWKWMQE
jgi:peptidoglycan/LPS O-acetylase OafA/YrhL